MISPETPTGTPTRQEVLTRIETHQARDQFMEILTFFEKAVPPEGKSKVKTRQFTKLMRRRLLLFLTDCNENHKEVAHIEGISHTSSKITIKRALQRIRNGVSFFTPETSIITVQKYIKIFLEETGIDAAYFENENQ